MSRQRRLLRWTILILLIPWSAAGIGCVSVDSATAQPAAAAYFVTVPPPASEPGGGGCAPTIDSATSAGDPGGVPCTQTYTRVISPGAVPRPAFSARSVGEGPYVAWNIIGGTLVAAGGAALVGGVVSLIEGGSSSSSDSGALGRGIALVDVAPHVLAAGIVTLAMNGSTHARANATPSLVAAPVVVPLASGGVFAGMEGAF